MTDQPSITVIDDLLHRILELHLTLLVDHIDLIAHPIQHQLFSQIFQICWFPILPPESHSLL
mgnify:FL=1